MTNMPTTKPAERLSEDEIRQLVQRAEQGDVTALPALRTLLDESPAVWNEYGNLALQAECSLVKLASGSNLMMSESLIRKLATMKAELAGPSPSPLEKLLSERIVACWLHVSYFDAVIAQTHGVSAVKANELRRMQDSAHRRFLTATKTLATIRKLLRPAPSVLDLLNKQVPETNGKVQSRRFTLAAMAKGDGKN